MLKIRLIMTQPMTICLLNDKNIIKDKAEFSLHISLLVVELRNSSMLPIWCMMPPTDRLHLFSAILYDVENLLGTGNPS